MLANTSTLLRRGAPRATKALLNQKQALNAFASVSFDAFYKQDDSPAPLAGLPNTIRCFATNAPPSRIGTVTKTLRVLDMDVVKKILEELRSVDVNSDGR